MPLSARECYFYRVLFHFREPRTMRLFMQSYRPNIFLPHEESAPSGVLAEQVGFTTSSDTLPGEFEEVSDSTDDVWKTIHLGGVDIVAARTVVKQVTMREGSVRLEFNIHVPSLRLTVAGVSHSPRCSAPLTVQLPATTCCAFRFFLYPHAGSGL